VKTTQPFAAALLLLVAVQSPATDVPNAPISKAAQVSSPVEIQRALARIDRLVEAKRKELHVPGMQIAIVQGDRVLLLKGYGHRDLERRMPMTPDTLCVIASLTKAFTATLTLIAAQEGRLRLDDPVGRHLPYFRLRDDEANRSITLADLLSHTSGLSRGDTAWDSPVLTAEECIRVLADAEPTFRFGEQAQYSNILVHAAAEATSAAYGRPWGTLLREKLLEPIGMRDTTLTPATELHPDVMAKGYWYDPTQNRIRRDFIFETWNIPGAGSLKSSARDMARWLRFHLGGGAIDGRRILSPELLEESYRPRIFSNDDLGWGLGWTTSDRRGTRVISHGGYLAGFQSRIAIVPALRLGVVVLTNNAGMGGDTAAMNIALDELVGKADRTWEDQYGKEAALYFGDGGRWLRVYASGLALWLVEGTGRPIKLKRTAWREYEAADLRNGLLKLTFTGTGGDTVLGLSRAAGPATFRRKAPGVEGISPEALMARIAAAEGGSEALRKSRVFEGRFEARMRSEGIRVYGAIYQAAPMGYALLENFFWSGIRLDTVHFGVGIAEGGTSAKSFRLMPMTGGGLQDSKIAAQLSQALDWEATFKEVELLARVDLGGVPAIMVRKVPHQGTPIVDFVCERTSLVVRREVGSPARATLWGDHRSVGGVALPHRITVIDSQARRIDYIVSGWKVADRYPAWAFRPVSYRALPD
jgi:CubicO group peptidase (beta-lactamase class C family)